MTGGEERTLVLGGTGFLGAALVETLRARAGRVISAARRPGRWEGAADVHEVELDLERAEGLGARLDELSPAMVFGLGALARAADCELEPERARRINAEAPAAVAAWCAARGRRFVQVSTDLVFSGDPPRSSGFREEDPPQPLHVYGRTKAEAERAVLTACPQALVVRLPLLAGDSRGRGVGASDSLLAAAQAGRVSALFTDEWRTPLDVDDAAQALAELARQELAGLLHLAGSDRLSRFELGLRVLMDAGYDKPGIEAVVRPATRADLGLTPPRPRDVSLDAARAKACLDLPLRPFRPRRG